MAVLIRMPAIAANAESGTIAAWLKKEGDQVVVDECVAEIETDKAVVEFTAERSGTLGNILTPVGQEVAVGTPIAVLCEQGETNVDVAALLAQPEAIDRSVEKDPAPRDAVIDDHDSAIGAEQLADQTATHDRIFASPLARRMARDEDVDLSALLGSGPLGRVVKRDIEAARVATPQSIKGDSVPGVASTFSIPSMHKDVPHSTMRRTIARRLVESKSTIPHFYLTADCHVDKLMALRAEFNVAASRKVSVNDFIVRAVALALRELPEMNVGWSDAALHYYDQADISIAVSTENGLQTPVVYAADAKSVTVIGAEIAELAARARDGKLKPEEYQGGNFTISNLGMYGVREFTAIINPPQSAILAVGAAEARPIVQEGAIVAASMMTVTLSVDHRAIDGALAAKWLAVLKRILENPLSTLT